MTVPEQRQSRDVHRLVITAAEHVGRAVQVLAAQGWLTESAVQVDGALWKLELRPAH